MVTGRYSKLRADRGELEETLDKSEGGRVCN